MCRNKTLGFQGHHLPTLAYVCVIQGHPAPLTDAYVSMGSVVYATESIGNYAVLEVNLLLTSRTPCQACMVLRNIQPLLAIGAFYFFNIGSFLFT